MVYARIIGSGLLAASLAACMTAPSMAQPQEAADLFQTSMPKAHDEPRPYNAENDAKADVAAALETAKAEGKMTIVAMGANWCHDSRGLAAQFEKERFAPLFKDHYELVYVDVGEKDRNIDIAQNFGVDAIYGTPTVFVVDTDGTVLNLDTAPTWRNADSRSEDEIWEYFHGFTPDADTKNEAATKPNE